MTDTTGASAALIKIGVHLVTAFAVLVGGVSMTSTAVDDAGVWMGRCVTGAATMYAGLGVSVFKEGVPGLRHAPGDPKLETAILRRASSTALRDTAVVAFIVGVGMLFVPPAVDARVALLAVLTVGYGDFAVRQHRVRMRVNDRERENPRPAEAERGF